MVTPVDRTQPDTGFNRSAMQRFLSLVHDTDGVTACNKPGAIVIAQGIPLLGTVNVCSGGLCSLGSQPFQECAVFKIENLAKFYLDSIVGKATLNFRSDFLKSGILGIGAATVDLVEQSSQIGLNANDTYGFWDDTSAKTFRPRPQWLNRLVFFDQTTHTSSSDPLNITQQFLATSTVPTSARRSARSRTITDPVPVEPRLPGRDRHRPRRHDPRPPHVPGRRLAPASAAPTRSSSGSSSASTSRSRRCSRRSSTTAARTSSST